VVVDIALPDNIIGIQDEDEFVNLMIYAESGTGKTVLAGSDDDVLFIAPEDNGTLSAKRFGSSAKKWKIRKWGDIVEAYEWLATLDEIPFNWIVLDSLTEMQQMCMRAILDEAVELNPGRDPDVPQLQDWQPYFERFRRLVKAFNSLPVNVLYTSLSQRIEDEDGETKVLPMIQGKGTQFAEQVVSWMTSFGYMSVKRQPNGKDEEGKTKYAEYRVIQWKATKTVSAKDRTRCLEPKTIVGDGKLGGLKDIRELLEAGPQQPAPGRVVETPVEKVAVRKRRKPADIGVASADGNHEKPVSLVTNDDEDDSDDDEGDDD
jgi:hypothetical protein